MSGFQTYKVETERDTNQGSTYPLNTNFPNNRTYQPSIDINEYQFQSNQRIVVDNKNYGVEGMKPGLDSKDKEIINLRESVNSLNNQINDYLRELDQWRLKYKQLQQEKGTQGYSSSTNDFEVIQLREENKRLKNQSSSGGNDWELQKVREELRVLKSQENPQNSRELQQLREEVKQLRMKGGDTTGIRQLQQENQKLSQKLQEYELEINELNKKIDEYVQEISLQQQRFIYQDKNSEMDGFLRKISALQHEVIQWKERYKAIESEQRGGDYYRSELIIKERETTIMSQSEKIRQLEDQNNLLRREQERIKKEMDGYRISFERQSDTGEVEQYKRRLAEMENDIQILIQDLQDRDSLQQRYSSLQNDYEGKVRELQIKVEEQRSQGLQQDSYQYQQIQEQYQKLQMQYQQLQDQNYQLEQELTYINSQKSKYQSDYERMQNEYMVFQRESETKYSQQSNQKLMDLQQQIQILQEDNGRMLMEVKQLRNQTSNSQFVQNEYQQLQEKYNSQSNLLKQLQDQCYKYKSEYEQLNQNYLQIQRESEQYKSNGYEVDQLRSKIREKDFELQTKSQIIEKLQFEQKQIERQVQDKLESQFVERLRQYESTIITKNSSESDNLRRQVQDLQFQLKDSENLRRQVQDLQFQLKESENLRRQVQDLQFQLKESENLRRQVQDLQFQLQTETQTKIMIERKMQNQILNQQDSETYRRQIQDLESRISQLNSKYELDIKKYQIEINSRNAEIQTLNQNISTLQIQHQLKLKEVTLKESQMVNGTSTKLQFQITTLENKLETVNLEKDRLNNINREHEKKIRVLIEKVTDYESRINILQQENTRLEQRMKRSTFIDKPQQSSQDNLYQMNTYNVEQKTQRINSNGQTVLIQQGQSSQFLPSYISPERLLPSTNQSNTGGKYQSTKSVKQAIMARQQQQQQ